MTGASPTVKTSALRATVLCSAVPPGPARLSAAAPLVLPCFTPRAAGLQGQQEGGTTYNRSSLAIIRVAPVGRARAISVKRPGKVACLARA